MLSIGIDVSKGKSTVCGTEASYPLRVLCLFCTKQAKKVFPISLGARCREFESPISDQTPSEINNFRGGFLFFVYCGAKIDAVIFAPHFQKSSTLYCEFCRIIV